MFILVALIVLAWPVTTLILENWDGSKKEICQMADRDRAKQMVGKRNRTLRYAVYQPLPNVNRMIRGCCFRTMKKPRRCNVRAKAGVLLKDDMVIVTLKGGFVK